MPDAPRDLSASVRARLFNHARETNRPFDLVLTRYVLERLLYRLGRSDAADRFVLKGAMLMMTWFDAPHRGTRDLDFTGFGDPDPEQLLGVFRAVMGQGADDGLAFDVEGLRAEPIRRDAAYGGVRLRTTARLGQARLTVVVDIGFGDAMEPDPDLIDYPVLLDMPPPRIRAYARETVIAEKFQAMVALGGANTRLKDFYDVWLLGRSHDVDGARLSGAIAATFARRGTEIPAEPPVALTPPFAEDAARRAQWRAFSRDLEPAPPDLGEVVQDLRTFLMPHVLRARR